ADERRADEHGQCRSLGIRDGSAVMTVARRASTIVAALILAAVGVLAGASIRSLAYTPAASHMQIALPGVGFTDHPDGSLLDMTRLAPGMTTSGVLGVRNGSGGPANLYLRMVDVKEVDGCPDGDANCSHGDIRIERVLSFTVEIADSRDGSYRPVWSGSASGLQDAVSVSSGLSNGQVRWVRLSATLPADAGNESQSETLHFGLQVALDGVDGESIQVLGAHAHHRGSSVLGLSLTGARLRMITTVGVLLVAIGLLVFVAGHRRNRRATGRSGSAE
ncbi:MAG TPA: hypothetical protein VKB75_08460, partial [Jatrophihabitans sp.]|nr:hypothetical protein [Jatrophihabitans sp.]